MDGPERKVVASSEEVFKTYIEPRVWTKWYDEGVPTDVEVPEIPLFKFLDDSASDFPDRAAMVFYGRKISYSELKDRVDRFAKALSELWNVSKGDRVAIFLPNLPQFAIAYYGALKAGATVTPVNPLYTGRELAYQLENSEARLLVALDIFKPKVDEALKSVSLDAVIYTGVDDYLPAVLSLLYRLKERKPKIAYDGRTTVAFRRLIREFEPRPPQVSIDPKEDIASLMYTGGTTGVPKGAMLTHYNLVSNVLQIDAWFKKGQRGVDVLVGVLPWFHIYGQTAVLNFGVFRAATILVYPQFKLEEVLKGIAKYRANMFHAVPTVYSLVVNYPDIKKFDISSIEACISGAAPLPEAIAKKFEELTGGRLREGYGLTETSPVTHVNPIFGRYKIGSIGVPVPSTYAAIAHVDKPELLPPGEVGEIVVSGPQVMKGYYKMPEENERAFFEAFGLRWFRTGDLGYMDEEGYFYVVDRKKDLIKYKGYSVYPREIEEVLYKHECVAEAAVIGVPDPKVGEYVKAFVALKPECKGRVTESDILEYCKRNLAPFKVPKVVEFRDELPKSTVGKVLRRVLREEELRKLKEAQKPK